MATRNRRQSELNSDDMESLSEHVARSGHRMAEEVSERASGASLAAFDAVNGPLAKVLDQNRMIFQKMMHAMHEESLRFVNRRLEHTGHAIQSSRDCQGMMGLVAVQQEFLMDLARDYADQTRRFAELVRELAEDGTQGMADVASASTDAVRNGVRRAETDHGATA
jgi:hypothetical protein